MSKFKEGDVVRYKDSNILQGQTRIIDSAFGKTGWNFTNGNWALEEDLELVSSAITLEVGDIVRTINGVVSVVDDDYIQVRFEKENKTNQSYFSYYLHDRSLLELVERPKKIETKTPGTVWRGYNADDRWIILENHQFFDFKLNSVRPLPYNTDHWVKITEL